jgi:hypothetical protein
MSVRPPLTLILLGICLLSSCHLNAQESPDTCGQVPDDVGCGKVSGRVVDSNGSPIAGALVRADLAGYSGIVLQTESDKDGNFNLKHVLPGHNWIEAKNDAGGYQNQWVALVDDLSDIVDIQVQPNQVMQGITIVLKRGGVFSGEVVDENGNPVRPVSIKVEDSSGRWYSRMVDKNGHFVIVLPDRPYDVTIAARGYKAPPGSDPLPIHLAIHLAPGSTQHVHVQLEKEEP